MKPPPPSRTAQKPSRQSRFHQRDVRLSPSQMQDHRQKKASQIAVSVRLLVATVVGACSSVSGACLQKPESTPCPRGRQRSGCWPLPFAQKLHFLGTQEPFPIQETHMSTATTTSHDTGQNQSPRSATSPTTNPAIRTSPNAAQRLRTTMAAVKLSFTCLLYTSPSPRDS